MIEKKNYYFLLRKIEKLLELSASKYKTTIEIARYAKKRRHESISKSNIKPVLLAILEISGELNGTKKLTK
nr:DNA-directed RNA polymerase omega subunit [Cyanidiaceae sp.]